MRYRRWLLLVGLLGAVLLQAVGRAAGADPVPAAPALVAADCAKCHTREITDLRGGGGAHGTAVGCLDCHPGHPPRDLEVIRPCSDCHQGNRHVDRRGPCLICHRNPHRPLQLTLAPEATGACLDCHPAVGEEFAAAPSLHAHFACTACHKRHGEAFPCSECHLAHADGEKGQQCRDCHSPHRPLAVEFGGGVDSTTCASCHAEIDRRLREAGGAHRQVGCAACHAGRHGTIPSCRQCHPEPHPAAILARFPVCTACHGDPHALNR